MAVRAAACLSGAHDCVTRLQGWDLKIKTALIISPSQHLQGLSYSFPTEVVIGAMEAPIGLLPNFADFLINLQPQQNAYADKAHIVSNT